MVVILVEGDNVDFVNFVNNFINLLFVVFFVVDFGGIVFNDINGDGLIDLGENGIFSVIVFFDCNGNVIFDNEEC